MFRRVDDGMSDRIRPPKATFPVPLVFVSVSTFFAFDVLVFDASSSSCQLFHFECK